MAVGDEPVVVHIVSFGAMEYIGADGEVTRRDTPSPLYETYVRFCTENNLNVEALR